MARPTTHRTARPTGTRRGLLAAAGLVALVATAGCATSAGTRTDGAQAAPTTTAAAADPKADTEAGAGDAIGTEVGDGPRLDDEAVPADGDQGADPEEVDPEEVDTEEGGHGDPIPADPAEGGIDPGVGDAGEGGGVDPGVDPGAGATAYPAGPVIGGVPLDMSQPFDVGREWAIAANYGDFALVDRLSCANDHRAVAQGQPHQASLAALRQTVVERFEPLNDTSGYLYWSVQKVQLNERVNGRIPMILEADGWKVCYYPQF